MYINFECKNCKKEFDCNVGKISMNAQSVYPEFEKTIICPQCGERTMEEVFLTEYGQLQMTDATLNS